MALVIPAVFLAGTAARIAAGLAARAGTDTAIKLSIHALRMAAIAQTVSSPEKNNYVAPKHNAAGNLSGEGFGRESGVGNPKKAKKNIKGLRRSKAALGIGKRKIKPRQANSNDIRRKGISLLKRGNASLARFIEARYGAKAIAKYQDYAGRLRRSIRLRKQVVKIDDATFRIKGYIIRTDTAGNNPYSCTCPDFSQFSNDDRNWLSSKAGPFNPCKHMMAVRDREKVGKWKCSNGICVQDPTGIYLSKSECEAKLILSELPVGTGQCDTLYYIYGSTDIYYRTRGSSNAWQYQSGSQVVNTFIRGPINIWVVNNAGAIGTTTEAFLKGRNPSTLAPTVQQIGNLTQFNNNLEYKLQMNFYSGKPDRTDGLPDNCGNAANVCPP